MIFGLDSIKKDLCNIQKSLDEAKELVPPAENLEEIEPDENISKEDLRFLKRCCQILMKLGYIKSQYEFSEQFLGKNKYYFGMILSEQRHPSLDAIHHLITGISQINDGLNKLKHLDNLYEEGQGLITKQLLKYL